MSLSADSTPKNTGTAQPKSGEEHTPLDQMLDAYDKCRADRDALLAACKALFQVIEARVRNAQINDWQAKLQQGRDAIAKAESPQ